MPSGVFIARPSKDMPYHWISFVQDDWDDDVDEGVKDEIMDDRVGFSSDMFVAELVPSTPAEIGLSTVLVSSSSKWFHGGEV